MTQHPQRSLPSLFSGMTCLLLGLLALGCGPSPSPELTWMKGLLPGESSLEKSAAWSTLQEKMGTERTNHTATLLPSGKVLIVGGDDATGKPLFSAELYDMRTGTWQGTDTLQSARAGHTATLLRNGQVLVVGGRGSANNAPGTSELLKTFELYDPVNNTWTQPENVLNSARYDHTATLLPSGEVLVTGGFFGDAPQAPSRLSQAEVYDPETSTWQSVNPMKYERSRHTATLLPSGLVLVVGGTASAITDDAEVYDWESHSWSAAGRLIQNRSEHTATLLPNGKVLIAGGKDMQGRGLSTAELYDPENPKWTASQGQLREGRIGHTAVLLFTGKVLVAGGYLSPLSPSGISSMEEYDPATDTWATGSTSLGTGRFQHTATLLPDGRVLVTGGFENKAVLSAEVYGSGMGRWQAEGALLSARSGHTVTLLPSGQVLITGGTSNGTTALNSAELHDPASVPAGLAAAPMGTARFHHTATLLPNGQVLVTGGTSNGSTALPTAELYDPSRREWRPTATPLNTARFHHTATLLPNGKVLVAGGTQGSGTAVETAELYDPASGQWSQTASLKSARFLHTATRLSSGQVLLLGGTQDGDTALDTAELYDPASGTWTSLKAPLGARIEHTATLLPSGRVMAAGGRNESSPLSSVSFYEYDSAKKELRESASVSLNTSRYAHTATLLPSGQVLITGGTNGAKLLADAELYDPVLNRWSLAPSLTTARQHATATLLPSGQVLLTGGAHENGPLGSFQAYEGPMAITDESSRPLPRLDSILPHKPKASISSTGRQLFNASETSGGNARSSSSTLPFVSLIAVDGGAVTPVIQWKATSDTEFSFTVPELHTGYYLLSATVQGASGGRLLLVDETPPAVPRVAQPLQNQVFFATRRPTLAGTAEPGSTVVLTLDGADAEPDSIDEQGNWSYTPSVTLDLGPHHLWVTATDQAGNSGEPSSLSFHIALPESHYGWGCASTHGLSLGGIWLVTGLWLRQRSRHRSAFPPGR